MCRMAQLDGCEVLVATPHQRTPIWPNQDLERLDGLLEEIRGAIGDRPRLLPGAEVRIDDSFLDELLPLQPPGILPLAGSRYLLLELDRGGGPPEPTELIAGVIAAGWRPILAHPEFIPRLARDLDRLTDLVAKGALLQITGMSLTGEFGEGIRHSVEQMVAAGLVHFVASDAHGAEWRPPGLRQARRVISSTWGEELARRLTVDNPRAVIEDRPLPDPGRPASTTNENGGQ